MRNTTRITIIASALLLAACVTGTRAGPRTDEPGARASADVAGARDVDEVTTTPSSQRPPAGDLRGQVARLNDELMARYRAGDMLGVAAMYSDDAVMLGPNGYRVAGREAIDAYWTRITRPIDWELEIVAVEGGRGLLHQRGVSRLRYHREDTGEPHTSTVQFVVIWVQQPDGGFRIGVDAYW